MENLIKKINSGDVPNYDEAKTLFHGMVNGELSEAQIASLLISMKYRGESVDELAALIGVIDGQKKEFKTKEKYTIDTCGTGGDGKSTVNVSTAVSLILASMGYNVLKHGNKAQSGKVGSADILNTLGFDFNYTGSSAEAFFEKHNYVFMMAPYYHPILKGVGKVRQEIKVPTIFNYVGPLVNPGNPDFQVIGINKREKLDFYTNVILALKRNNITIYSSYDGYDEVSSKDKTECRLVNNDNVDSFVIDPSDYFEPFDMPQVNSNDEAKNLFIQGLSGSNESIVNIFSLNTALALRTMGTADLKMAFADAKKFIKSGRVINKLESMVG